MTAAKNRAASPLFLCQAGNRKALSCVWATVGGLLRGDDHGAGRIRDADRLPAEQLSGAAAAVHGPGVCLVHRSGGHPHAQYVQSSHTLITAAHFASRLTRAGRRSNK